MIEIIAVLAIGSLCCLILAALLARVVDLALEAVDEIRLLLADVVARIRSALRR